MTTLNATRIALHALGRNKLRSMLTALGIIIGVGLLIALLGIGHGARAEVEKRVASLWENVIRVSAGSISKRAVKLRPGSSGALTVEDAEAIRQEIFDAVAVSPRSENQKLRSFRATTTGPRTSMGIRVTISPFASRL